MLASLLRTNSDLTLRCVVLAAGEGTTVVVAGVVIAVFVRPELTVPLALSSHEACTSIAVAAEVTICTRSEVEERIINGYLIAAGNRLPCDRPCESPGCAGLPCAACPSRCHNNWPRAFAQRGRTAR